MALRMHVITVFCLLKLLDKNVNHVSLSSVPQKLGVMVMEEPIAHLGIIVV